MNPNVPLFRATSLVTTGIVLLTASLHAADPFAEGVRPTEPLTPQEQQKTFHLPPGFEIDLVTSEPHIRKPMNMAFDAKGRLWVTDSREYPFPAPLDKPARDAIKVLEDTDGDGRFDKISTFADGLNIPIGLYPWGNGVVAWSIPNIWFFEDTDGDGKADRREVLYGPLGWERDTHGNNASFRRGDDGWLYITHGYNNNSTVRGRDGSSITMNSGNTYRVQLDGSRVEQFTWGQVNPFGMCFDPLGNIFTADCHSAPVYQLLRGGYYPSFGKPHDGLGFVPEMLQHSHGSTAICGIQFITDPQWPAELRENFLIGNVMTSRINRDSVVYHGSTLIAREESDFLRTDDPWFRPVDLQFGPDGALYVADFYNRIIGHYEVPLLHPGRDRERGRIWRIRYTGGQKAGRPFSDISRAAVSELLEEIGNANPTRRTLALNELVDRLGAAASRPTLDLLNSSNANPHQRAECLWALHRLGSLPMELLKRLSADPDRMVRTHAMRVLSETPAWMAGHRELVLNALNDVDAFVQRAAADALGQHPDFEHVSPLLAARSRVPSGDTHLLHTIRMALRNQLRPTGNLSRLQQAGLDRATSRVVAELCVSIATPESASFLLQHVQATDEDQDAVSRYLRHTARHLPEAELDALARFVQGRYPQDVTLQLAFFKSVEEGTAQRGVPLTQATKAWGSDLARSILRSTDSAAVAWQYQPIESMPRVGNPWFLQARVSADGDRSSLFLCSLPPGGEQLTGLLRSQPFQVPSKLNFFVAGHDGVPGQPAQKRNMIRLIEEESGKVLSLSYPPRNDLAQRVEWDLAAHAGKKARIELVDGDAGDAYAWIAAGRFEPGVVPFPKVSPNQTAQQQQQAAGLVRSLALSDLETDLIRLLNSGTDLETAASFTGALAALQVTPTRVAVATLVADTALPIASRQRLSQRPAAGGADSLDSVVVEAVRAAPLRTQVRLAQALAATRTGAAALFQLVESGSCLPRVLLDRSVRDKIQSVDPVLGARIMALTKGLTPVNADVEKLIERRRADYRPQAAKAERGAQVFNQSCAACHQIGGQGQLVGPQLDGIGNRGLERLLEDILDPNRNVDHAFRSHTFTMKDGEVISGLPRREEGELLILADSTGKEISIPKKQIEARRESETSLMPENFGDVLSGADLDHLLAFLFSSSASSAR